MAVFERRPIEAVGVDIGTSSVKVMELQRTRRGYRVNCAAVESLPRNAVVERGISNVEQVSAALRRAAKRARCKRKNAIVAIASSHVVTRTFQLPEGIKAFEIEEQVMIDAAQNVPYSVDEMYLDYQVLASTEAGVEDSVTVTACRREIVDDYVSAVGLAGLRPVVVDVDTFAIARAFPLVTAAMSESLQGKAVALLDVGEVTTHLDVFVDGVVIYDRDHSFGGRSLTESIQSHCDISFEEAEAVKLSRNLSEGDQEQLLEPFKRAISQEAARALEFFASAGRGYDTVDLLFVTGGCLRLDGILQLISNYTGVPTATANPFSGRNIKARMKLKLQPTLLLKACGLAMRGAG